MNKHMKTYLILTHDQLNDIIKKSLSSKHRLFGLTTDNRVQTTLCQSNISLIRLGRRHVENLATHHEILVEALATPLNAAQFPIPCIV
jgi:hypothetical protein